MATNPRPARRCLLPMLLAGLLAAPLTGALAADDRSLTPIPERPAAPGFDLKDPEGRPQRLADYRGKPVILNFWATWCPPCREEMPSIQRAYETLAPEGIAVVAINVGDDAAAIGQFLEDEPLDFALPMDTDSKVAQRYPMNGLPTTFVIDPEGRLVYSAMGSRAWDDPKLLDQVRALKSTTVPGSSPGRP
ncbi:peroxiredoxin [uncultured Thiodictyon sp.]|uniref:peroxiredoxin family protein n=1 Tax=uncultured Thiodictyon sp. TaxID=1846217 RepID=UPI0025E9D3B2|nr:TlpA disulfide reductase family protein [uncultured Thiodictyon sp.]